MLWVNMQTLHATGTGRVNSLVSCSVRGVIALMCRRVHFCAVQVSNPQRMINSTMVVGHDAPRGCEGSRALGAERSLTTPKDLSSRPSLHQRLPQRSGADCHNQHRIGKRAQAAGTSCTWPAAHLLYSVEAGSLTTSSCRDTSPLVRYSS